MKTQYVTFRIYTTHRIDALYQSTVLYKLLIILLCSILRNTLFILCLGYKYNKRRTSKGNNVDIQASTLIKAFFAFVPVRG
jgi:hypothetical protein